MTAARPGRGWRERLGRERSAGQLRREARLEAEVIQQMEPTCGVREGVMVEFLRPGRFEAVLPAAGR
jgi:hypothetical protein